MSVSGQTDNFQSYSYNNLGISLKKPSDWAFASLKNGLQLIKEKDLVYLEIRKSNPQPSNTTLEQLALHAIQERFSSRKDFQVLNISKTSISGNLPAYKAAYEFLKTPNENSPTNEGTTNKVLRITTFVNGVAYIVKYVSEKSKYDSYLPIAEKIIDSLKFNVQENVKAKSDNNNINNNNNNHKTSSNNNNDNNNQKSKGYGCRFFDVKVVESNKNLPVCEEKAKIKVGYGDLGSYNGKAKIVIKNEDTGKTMVTHDINFAKLRASEGDNCCYKFYTFDVVKTGTKNGDTISAKVWGGEGGSWESGPYKYENNLRIGMTLDEIDEVNEIKYDKNYNPDEHKHGEDIVCDSDKSTKAPSCDKFEKEWQGDNNDNTEFEPTGNLSGG